MTQVTIILFVAAIIFFILGLLKFRKFNSLAAERQKEISNSLKELERVEAEYTERKRQIQNAEAEYLQKQNEMITLQAAKEHLLAEKEKAAVEAVRLQEQNKAAIAKTQEEVKAEYAQLKLKLSKEHDLELQTLRLEHEKWLQEHIDEFSEYTKYLDNLRQSIAVVEQKKKDEVMKEDFIATHTLNITTKDYEDIATLMECRGRLNRKSVLDNLVWGEFVQGPLQQLRKELVSVKLTEKVCGIYRITNTENDRCYIGQAVDIGNRWTEHIKAALNNPSDKFHKALAIVPLSLWTWEILEKCDKPKLNEREKYWITHYNSNEFGYNTTGGNK